jgi:hypothetical protein
MWKAEGGGAATAGPFAHYTASPSAIYAQADAITRPTGSLTTLKGDVRASHARAWSSVTGDLAGPLGTAPRPVDENTTRVMRMALVSGGCVRLWGNAVTNFNRDVDGLNNEYATAAADSFGVTKPVVQDNAARHSAEESFDDDVSDAKAAKLAELKRRYVGLEKVLDTAAGHVASMLEKGPDDETTVAMLYGAGALPPAAAVQAFPALGRLPSDPRDWGLRRGPEHWHSWWDAGGDAQGPKGSWGSESGPGYTPFSLKGFAYLLQGRGPGFAPGDTYAYKIGTEGDANANIGRNGLGLHLGGKVGAWGNYTRPAADGGVTAQGTGDGFVGGETNLDVNVGPNGAEYDVGALAGGRVGDQISAQHEASGISVTTRAEGWGGYGGKSNFGLTTDNGKIDINANAGAALGWGGKLGVDVTIDPDKLFS